MSQNSKLFEILVCPQCKGKLAQVEAGQGLLCKRCQLKYPVRDGIPVMLVEEAFSMRGETPMPAPGSSSSPKQQSGTGTQVFQHRVTFRALSGPDEGLNFDLSNGQCRALGRAVSDTTKTTVLSVDWAISLDEETKGLVLQYISQQFRKPPSSNKDTKSPDQIGAFKRVGDIVFKDNTLSRLHAMIFFDDIGIGILDLVSKNGTFVNGEEIESRLLKKGDTIELGETKLVFEG